jgi:predicted PurR-regulated permease PerM
MAQESARQLPTTSNIRDGRSLARVRPTRRPGPRLLRLSVWQALALIVIGLVVSLGLAAIIQIVIRPLALLFAAIIIAESLSPLVDRMAKHIPRGLAVAVPYLVFVATIGLSGWLIYPTLVSEAQSLVDRSPELIDKFQSWADNIDPTGDGRIREWATNALQQASGALSSIPFAIVSSVAEVVLVIAMSLYWLIAKPSMRDFVLSLLPEALRDDAVDTLNAIGRTIGGYVRAQLIAGFVIGSLTYVGLTIIGVDYALVLAVVAGLGEVVPIVGPILSAIPAIAVALLTSPTQAIIVAAFYLILQQIESNVLQPSLVRNQADIPPLLVLFSLFVGGTVGGILGALVAVPLSGAIKVIVVRVVAPAVRRWSGAEPEPIGANQRETS